jgi:hypothetical protein
MQIIGISGREELICIISKDEVCRVFNGYTNEVLKREGRGIDFSIGKEIDLGAGYKFKQDILNACSAMMEASERFCEAQKTLLAFSELALTTLGEGSKAI